MNEENTENFNHFLQESKETESVDEEVEENNIVSIENLEVSDVLSCPYCGYIPRKHCKNKLKAIQSHIKKHHPDKLNEFLNNNNINSNRKVKKENTIEILHQIDESSTIVENEDDKKLKLVQDIDILKMKFPNIYTCPTYSYPESSIDHLKRIKGNYARLINDSLTSKMVFGTVVALGKGAERVTDSLNICDLDGYANNIAENEEELISIIQELMDSDVLDISFITPEIKLAICLLNIGIRTAETNKIKKNNLNIESVAPI